MDEPTAPATRDEQLLDDWPAATIHLSRGRWIRLRLASVNTQLLLMDLPLDASPDSRVERMRELNRLFDESTVATSWNGRAGDLTPRELTALYPLWLVATEDDAIPPVSGSSSDTPPVEPRSLEQTENAGRSDGRRASPSSKPRRRGASRPGRSPAKSPRPG